MVRVLFLGNITVFSLVGDPVFDNFTVKKCDVTVAFFAVPLTGNRPSY